MGFVVRHSIYIYIYIYIYIDIYIYIHTYIHTYYVFWGGAVGEMLCTGIYATPAGS